MYKLMYKRIFKSSCVLRLCDRVCIPADALNSDYAEYIAWLDAGNTPEPACIPPVDYKALAKSALDRSDTTVLRCYSAGIPVPPEWQAYRVALRGIVGSGVGPLPVQPDYPEGS